jgi:hypothetical protein
VSLAAGAATDYVPRNSEASNEVSAHSTRRGRMLAAPFLHALGVWFGKPPPRKHTQGVRRIGS